MSWTRETTLWCEGSYDDGERCVEFTTRPWYVSDARDEARRDGWVFRNRRDLCPIHARNEQSDG